MPKCLKLAGIFLVTIIAGCGGKTTAPFDFTIEASVTEGTAPLEVRFTTTVNSGKMPVIFTWNFGDGGDTVYDQNPTHIYETAGVFTATLDATDDAGKYLTKTIDITVVEPLEVIAAADPTEGIAPLLVNFSSSVTGGTEPYTYLWDFKDGETAATASTSHIFQTTGEFTVSLTVTDSGGASGQSEVVVTVADDHTPVASITANPTVGVAPLEVTSKPPIPRTSSTPSRTPAPTRWSSWSRTMTATPTTRPSRSRSPPTKSPWWRSVPIPRTGSSRWMCSSWPTWPAATSRSPSPGTSTATQFPTPSGRIPPSPSPPGITP
jgi:PKD repeat protein